MLEFAWGKVVQITVNPSRSKLFSLAESTSEVHVQLLTVVSNLRWDESLDSVAVATERSVPRRVGLLNVFR